jgi:hypothetical protein
MLLRPGSCASGTTSRLRVAMCPSCRPQASRMMRSDAADIARRRARHACRHHAGGSAGGRRSFCSDTRRGKRRCCRGMASKLRLPTSPGCCTRPGTCNSSDVAACMYVHLQLAKAATKCMLWYVVWGLCSEVCRGLTPSRLCTWRRRRARSCQRSPKAPQGQQHAKAAQRSRVQQQSTTAS